MASNGLQINSHTKYLYQVVSDNWTDVFLSKSYAINMAKRQLARAKGPVTVLQAEIVWGGVVEDLPEEITMHNLVLLGSGYEPPEKFPSHNDVVKIEKVGSKWYGYYHGDLMTVERTKRAVSEMLYAQYFEDYKTWNELKQEA